MLPGLTGLDAVDRGGVHAKLLGDLAHRFAPSCQLALDLQHLGLRQHRHSTPSLAAGLMSLTLRLAYGFCTYSFFGGRQSNGLLGVSQINLHVLARIKRETSQLKCVNDLIELAFRKDVHVQWMERVQCSRQERVSVNSEMNYGSGGELSEDSGGLTRPQRPQ